jgi:hypothetical protein
MSPRATRFTIGPIRRAVHGLRNDGDADFDDYLAIAGNLVEDRILRPVVGEAECDGSNIQLRYAIAVVCLGEADERRCVLW